MSEIETILDQMVLKHQYDAARWKEWHRKHYQEVFTPGGVTPPTPDITNYSQMFLDWFVENGRPLDAVVQLYNKILAKPTKPGVNQHPFYIMCHYVELGLHNESQKLSKEEIAAVYYQLTADARYLFITKTIIPNASKETQVDNDVIYDYLSTLEGELLEQVTLMMFNRTAAWCEDLRLFTYAEQYLSPDEIMRHMRLISKWSEVKPSPEVRTRLGEIIMEELRQNKKSVAVRKYASKTFATAEALAFIADNSTDLGMIKAVVRNRNTPEHIKGLLQVQYNL